MADKVIAHMGGDVAGKTIALLGLAFKPNTDDMREAPSIDIVSKLQEAGAILRAYDPASMEEASHVMKDVLFCDGPYHAIENADAVVIITEWDQFRALDLDRVKNSLKAPNVVDLRNIYQSDDMRERGFNYTSVGRAY
jgi:UDPglucose 6-dehydrogenase